jgi:hypothetical protein
MALFGRKKEEDEFDEEEGFSEEEELKDRKLTRKFRDLNPENKRKRKEPPKPWGKKERIVVIAVLLTTIIISAVLALGAKGEGIHLNIGMPRINLDFLNIFKEKTIIIK